MTLTETQVNTDVIGILKSMEIEAKTTKSGAEALGGYVVVEVTDDEKGVVNNLRFNVWANKLKKDGKESKLYTSLLTVRNEYKTKDNHGDDADLISVSGSIDINDYVGQQGLTSRLQLRGQFFNRIEDKTTPQRALMSAKLAVVNYTPVLEDGVPVEPATEKVEAYLIGYKMKIIPLELVIHDNQMGLLDSFKSLYMPNSTGVLTLKINNYPDTTEKEKEPIVQEGGFGQMMEPKTFTKFVSEYEIVGGQQPLDDGLGYSLEDITEIKELRRKQLTLIEQDGNSEPKVSMPMDLGFGKPATPPTNEAVSQGTPTQNTTTQDGGIPAF